MPAGLDMPSGVGDLGMAVITLVTARCPRCQFSSKIGSLRIKLVKVGNVRLLPRSMSSQGEVFHATVAISGKLSAYNQDTQHSFHVEHSPQTRNLRVPRGTCTILRHCANGRAFAKVNKALLPTLKNPWDMSLPLRTRKAE
jgi:hypothetical protein